MRILLPVLLPLGLLLGGHSQIQAQDDVRGIIKKAIKAHGGDQNLAKFQAGQTKSKGTIIVLGQGLDFTQELTYQLPNQFREVLHLEGGGQKATVITVYNGTEGWVTANGKAVDLDKKLLNELKEVGHLMTISRLSPLLEDKAIKLSPAGEEKVNGKVAVGVRVERKDYRDATLFFDKDTGLVLKMKRQALDAVTKQEVDEERFVMEYQKIEGMQSPKKMVINRDGKKFMEVEVAEVKLLDKVDPATFAKP